MWAESVAEAFVEAGTRGCITDYFLTPQAREWWAHAGRETAFGGEHYPLLRSFFSIRATTLFSVARLSVVTSSSSISILKRC